MGTETPLLALLYRNGVITSDTGWDETEVFMEVSSRRLAIVQHFHLPARGLLSLISLLRAFSLNAIKRNQSSVSSRRLAIVQHRHPPARGLLSLISLLSAFLLTGIKRNQVFTLGDLNMALHAHLVLQVRHEGSPGGVCPCHFQLVTRVR